MIDDYYGKTTLKTEQQNHLKKKYQPYGKHKQNFSLLK